MLRGARLSFDAAIAAGSAVKLDATAAGVLGRVSGYGAIFNATPNRRGFRLMANAFTRSRHAVPLPMLWCHAQPVGRWDEVHQDERGLRLHGELNLDVELGRRALAHIKHGDTLGLSVGFTVAKTAGAVIDRDGVLEVHDADLLEVSITPVPAEPAARIDSLQ
jgi:HK97 family phage prohead protease